jgi:hypothetical protein
MTEVLFDVTGRRRSPATVGPLFCVINGPLKVSVPASAPRGQREV